MEVIAVANQKGGVAKTTTAVNLAVALAQKGNKVALMDLDPQGNVALSFGIRPDTLEKNLFTVFMEDCSLKEIIIKTHYKVEIIPSNRNLSVFNLLVEQNKKERSPALWVREILKGLRRYDYLVIDNPPALDWLTINGLSAADYLLIPTQAELFAEAGVSDLISTYHNVKKNYNPKLEIMGIVMTMFSPRTNLSSVVSQDINKYCKANQIRVFNTAIKRSVRFGEAALTGQPAIVYARGNEAVQDYVKLMEEITNG